MKENSTSSEGNNPIRYQISSQQVFTQVQGSAIILSFTTNNYYSLDETGSMIWNALKRPITIPDLCNQVCSSFEVDPKQALNDLLKLISLLEAENLVVKC